MRLAALSLRGHSEPGRFLAEFAGTDRAVADYLIAEVLARLPEDNREFMLRTCLVDAVSPELADALTGGEGGTLPLVELERLGAPVQPTAADGRWYRYHPLFAELLRAHLHHAHPRRSPRCTAARRAGMRSRGRRCSRSATRSRARIGSRPAA